MMNRRTFILGSAAGVAGVLAIGWTLSASDERLDARTPLPAPPDKVPLNGWVMISPDDTVTIVMSKAEMGQGVHTGAAMLLAEELGADWSRVRVVQSHIDRIYADRLAVATGLPFRPDDQREWVELVRRAGQTTSGLLGLMITGGSTSLPDLWMPMREAGASAREMLCTAAAREWKVPVNECLAKSGSVVHVFSGKSATFGKLVPLAKDLPHPQSPALKPIDTHKLIGRSLKRIEAAPKLDGSMRFGIDILPAALATQHPRRTAEGAMPSPDSLLYASVMMCPALGGRFKSFRTPKPEGKTGVFDCFPVDPYNGSTGGLAVVATNPYIAMRTLCELDVEWDHGPAAKLNTADVRAILLKALDKTPTWDAYEKNADTPPPKDGKTLHMQYETPYLAHGALEPVNCTVQFDGRSATVWVSTQVPKLARAAAARALDLGADDVTLHQEFIGGAFGRRLEVDYVAQAAAIASRFKGKAVQTIWPRSQDTAHDFYRPACVARYSGTIDANGTLVSWRGVSASQSVTEQVLERAYCVPGFVARHLPDATMAEGAFDQPYECASISVRHTRVELPIPVGYWRSVGHSHQAFFVESFLDEMAAAAGKDPIEFRLAMLKEEAHRPHADVLRKLAEISHWRGPHKWRDKGVEFARGVALHESFGSIVGQVAVVRRDPEECFRVTDVFCVVDCGVVVNPNLVAQQMEGGIVFGLSAALEQEVTLVNGRVQQHYFSEVALINMETCPRITTWVMRDRHKLPGRSTPKGVGEAGTPPIAPAVANAVALLTGCRPYRLPLRQADTIPRVEEEWKGDRWCVWCRSRSTGRPERSTPSPKRPCFGCSAANSG